MDSSESKHVLSVTALMASINVPPREIATAPWPNYVHLRLMVRCTAKTADMSTLHFEIRCIGRTFFPEFFRHTPSKSVNLFRVVSDFLDVENF
jgi:hypothetical protein